VKVLSNIPTPKFEVGDLVRFRSEDLHPRIRDTTIYGEHGKYGIVLRAYRSDMPHIEDGIWQDGWNYDICWDASIGNIKVNVLEMRLSVV